MVTELYNFPRGTTAKKVNKNNEDFYVISYESPNKIETPFGVVSEKWFSTENRLLEDAINTFENSLINNGFTKINNIWQ